MSGRKQPAEGKRTGPAKKAARKREQPPKQPVRRPRRTPYTSALLLTVREAASLLRISERKMYYLLANETISALKIDNSTRIKRSVIDNYIAALERVSA